MLKIKIKTLQIIALTLAGLFGSANAVEPQAEVELTNLDCASDYLAILPQLGRGEDYPAFLVRDIDAALKQQSASSILSKVECTSDVIVSTTSVEVPESENNALSSLKIVFPLLVEVVNGNTKYRLTVDQHYTAENLETFDNRQVNQLFEVKKQETIQ